MELKFRFVDVATEEPTVKLGRYAFTVVVTDGSAAEKFSEMGFRQVNVAIDTSVDLKFPVDPKFRLADAATEEPTVKLGRYHRGGYRWSSAEKPSQMGFCQVNVATDTSVDLKFRFVNAATEDPIVSWVSIPGLWWLQMEVLQTVLWSA